MIKVRVLVKALLSAAIILFAHTSRAELPEWILFPPSSDTELFAIGEGKSLQQANDIALKNILGQLRTRISGGFSQQQSLVNDAFAEYINQSVSSSIESLPISQYKKLKNHQEDDTFFSLVSVEKAQLADTFRSELTSNFYQLSKALRQQNAVASKLEWWVQNKPQLLEQFGTNLRYIEVLDVLSQPTDKYKTLLSQIETQLNDIQSNVCLYVQPHKNENLSLAFRQLVLSQGLNADNKGCEFTLTLTDKIKLQELFKQHVASLSLDVKLNKNKQPIASEIVNESGRSIQSQANAREAAYQRLITKIESDDGAILTSLLTQ
ncbi:LPP20 family lipoprotein [Alteromonas lipolytica]|uniref:LPP20 lipoprotein n=1 Tax=Alteromonas lipolytica TaxID=1856405 RepID=A0A1E8FAB9_9ALTE|nr:LPP20 family lipoprotein [Alteromonas lipolytica]OFI32859.1 hypothetical protein BFC17_00860 [Alteromonas lipolytica]GGF64710.1 hypothetical protein GCM10011338_16370 [Alteromonas lipolytica]